MKWRNIDLAEGKLQVAETAFKLSDGTYVIKEPTPYFGGIDNHIDQDYTQVEEMK